MNANILVGKLQGMRNVNEQPSGGSCGGVGMRGMKVFLIDSRFAWESWWRENAVNRMPAARGERMMKRKHVSC